MKKANGYIIYNGPSVLDGSPIIAVALMKGNKKTGSGIQIQITRSDMDPRVASKTGCDSSICGDCKHKGVVNPDSDKVLADNRSCYVNIGMGVLNSYRSYLKGGYPDISNNPEAIAELGRDKFVRVGLYGDGHALPDYVVDTVLKFARNYTAYSHQINHESINKFRNDIYMVSADNLQDAKKHWSNGMRTFRVIRDASEVDTKNEILCPNHNNKDITCDKCKLCAGSSINAKSIANPVHGSGSKHF